MAHEDIGAAGPAPAPSRDLAGHLARTAPFTGLSRSRREELAAGMTERPVAAGEAVLVEGGAPGTALYLVRDGSFELLRDGRVVDVIGAGQLFGHPTLLTGYPPEFTVRAREDSTLLVVPGEEALDVLSRPEGVAFVAATLRDRLVRSLRVAHDERYVRTLPIAALVRGPALFCGPETPVAEAARRMSAAGAGAILVQLADGFGIVTNADLRDKVLARGAGADIPVSTIMTRPVLTVSTDALAPEASIAMLEAGVQHLPVLDGSRRVLGILSTGDLMALDEVSPFALRRTIAKARDEDEVVAAAGGLREAFLALLDARLEAPAITRVLTLQCDAMTVRLLELAQERLGRTPVPWAWLAVGSAGRAEMTVVSDQDNALAYADTEDQAVVEYFEKMARAVNDGLARCGFALDYSGVNALNPGWRLTESQWQKAFAACFASPDHSHLIRASIVFDFRQVAGELPVAPELAGLVRRASGRTGFIAAMAQTVTEVPSPLGFLRRLRGPIDIKKAALLPAANIARFHALANGVTSTTTLDRLRVLETSGAMDTQLVEALRHTFVSATEIRLRHHGDALRGGREPDDAIDTELLDPLTHAELQQGLRLIDSAQQLTQSFPLGLRR